MFAAIVMMALASPPVVLQAAPDHGDGAVSPALTELRIEFDQDMATAGWSLCGGGPLFPKTTGKPRWETTRVLVLPVSLEPAHEYRFSINCPAARNTRSAADEPAEVTPIWFKTAADAASSRVPTTLTPAGNQQALAELERAVQERYSYRDRVVKDWSVYFGKHRDALKSAGTPAAFAREAARLLAHAEDLHVSLIVGDESWNVRFPTARRAVTSNADLNTLEDLVPGWERVSETVQWGRYDDGILVLAVHECSDIAAEAACAVLKTAKRDGWVKAVVLDLRSNAGGDELAARRIAGTFLDSPRTYAKNRYRDTASPDGWGPLLARVVDPAPEPERLLVPTAVLTGRYCMSSCESFILMLKGAPGVITVGETTFGSSGNPRPVELGNGVTVLLSSWEDLTADGATVEGIGVPPDIKVECDPADFQSSDPVLERSLQELRVKIDTK